MRRRNHVDDRDKPGHDGKGGWNTPKGLEPAADQPADFVEGTGRVFVAARAQMFQLKGEPKQEPQFLDTEVRARQQWPPIPCVGRFHKKFEHVERGCLDAVAKQEFLVARKFFNGGHEPKKELEMGLDRWTCDSRRVGHRRSPPKKNRARGYAPGPERRVKSPRKASHEVKK